MDELFDLPPDDVTTTTAGRGRPRLQRPDRDQVELRATHLDALLPPDHRARAVWDFVAGLDLAPLYARIRAVEGHPGRPPIDPAILVALWLYATLEGVGSARALARLCDEHDAYRWIAGGVGVNHHTLADVRVDHADILDDLLTGSVAALVTDGLVTLDRVAQDGMRVRAGAGAASFRRRDALDAALADAEARVTALRAELDDDPAATSRRVAAARERAAWERTERVRRALDRLPEVEAARRRHGRSAADARTSTTDPDARVMKMADGGFRPAFNVQLATDTASGVVVGVDITDVGSDAGLLGPMVRQLERRYDRAPAELLADGGFVVLDDIAGLADGHGTIVYAPPTTPHDPARDPFVPLPGDHPAVAAWRVRMGTDAAKAIYRQRAAAAECVNAQARNRGLQRLPVRGLGRARAVLLWFALAHNLVRTLALRAPGAASPASVTA
ncbi:MAG: IS1182 family transposase [Chloroflexi bacterium]|nr:IS1182 family transposase [Chloroflexota bacterium]